MRGPVSARSYARQALEQPRQMRLIREPKGLRHVCYAFACCQAALCGPKPLLQVVGVGWHSNRSREGTSEMKTVEADCGGELCQSDVAGAMLG